MTGEKQGVEKETIEGAKKSEDDMACVTSYREGWQNCFKQACRVAVRALYEVTACKNQELV